MLKFVRVLMLVAVLSLSYLLPFEQASAAADTCTWTGALNANWDNSGNWTGCDNSNLPEANDALVFPESALNKSMVNDFAPSTPFSQIDVTGSGYTFGGNSFELTSSSAIDVDFDTTLDADVTYSGFNIFFFPAAGATLTVNGTTNFASGGGEVNVGSSLDTGTVDFVGDITGTAATQFIAVDGARAIVRGSTNTYTASTVGAESGAHFECRSTTCFGNNANNIYTGNGQVDLFVSATYTNDWQTSVSSPGTSWIAAYDNISITGSGTVNDAVGISQETASRDLQFTGSITLNGSVSLFTVDTTANLRIDGPVSGSEAFSIGAGSFRLTGPSTYSGTNTVNSGAIVEVTGIEGLGDDTGTTNVLSGGSVRFNLSAPGTVTEPFQINGQGVSSEGVLQNIGSTPTLEGDIVLAGDVSVGSYVSNESLTFNGVVSGTGDIQVIGTDGSVSFGGASPNTYDGDLYVTSTGASLIKDGAAPGDLYFEPDHSTTGTSVYINAPSDAISGGVYSTGATGLEYVGFFGANEEINGLSQDTNTVMMLCRNGSTLTTNQDFDTTFGGMFNEMAGCTFSGVRNIVKQGTGTLTLTGDDSTTTTIFDIQAGAVAVNGNRSGTIFGVNGGMLKGSGTLGATSITSGSFSPGNSPGCVTVSSLALASGATYTQELAGATACTQYDQTTVTGTATLGNATLNILPSYTPAAGSVFTILTAGSVSGTFNGLANNATTTVSGVTYRINYTATSVTLTVLAATTTSSPPLLQSTGMQIATSSLLGAAFIILGYVVRRTKIQNHLTE